MESKRQLQLGNVLQKDLSEVFQRNNMEFFGRAMVTVTRVYLTPDLGLARVYLSIFNVEDKDEVMANVQELKHKIKKLLVEKIRKKMRIMPKLEFYQDETLDNVFRMEELFKDLKKDKPKEEE